jgi:CHAT domain-containing protein
LENGNIEEDNYLCEKFNLTRWIEGKEFVQKENIKSGLIVIPNDTNLKNAILESDWLMKFGDDLKLNLIFSNTYQAIISSLQSNSGFDLIHFSTHGKSDPSNIMFSSIILQNGLYLRPENISGIATNFGKSNPLVFLNACQSGSQGFFLTGIEGWAQRFIDNGASIFIGTRWSIDDKIALEFSKEFYTNISNGKTIGESIRLARIKCKKPGDSSWLAYQVYAEPNSYLISNNH